jgi:hypothetical protein
MSASLADHDHQCKCSRSFRTRFTECASPWRLYSAESDLKGSADTSRDPRSESLWLSKPTTAMGNDMKDEFNQIVTYEDICQAIQDLAEEGLIVDSGRKKWSKRTGQYEILWMLSPIAREAATKTPPLLR